MKSSFAEMNEPERMVFIAQLCHDMWYNEDCYQQVLKLTNTWESKDIPKAVFYPKTNENETRN